MRCRAAATPASALLAVTKWAAARTSGVGVGHGYRGAGVAQHFQVIGVVADRHDVAPVQAQKPGPNRFTRLALGAAGRHRLQGVRGGERPPPARDASVQARQRRRAGDHLGASCRSSPCRGRRGVPPPPRRPPIPGFPSWCAGRTARAPQPVGGFLQHERSRRGRPPPSTPTYSIGCSPAARTGGSTAATGPRASIAARHSSAPRRVQHQRAVVQGQVGPAPPAPPASPATARRCGSRGPVGDQHRHPAIRGAGAGRPRRRLPMRLSGVNRVPSRSTASRRGGELCMCHGCAPNCTGDGRSAPPGRPGATGVNSGQQGRQP